MLVAIIFGVFDNITQKLAIKDLIWRYYWKKVVGSILFSFGDYKSWQN